MVRSKPPRLAPLAPLLQRFSRSRVVVVGDFVADEYVYGETERISREAPVLIVRYERSELTPGGAGNAAQNLAALGVDVRAVGLVGDDALGSRLLDVLRAGAVDVRGIQRVRGRATEAKTRILAGRPLHPPPADAPASTAPPSRSRRPSSAASSPTSGAPPAGPPPCWPATTAPGVLSPRVVEALRGLRRRRDPGLRRLPLRAERLLRPHHAEAQRARAGGGHRDPGLDAGGARPRRALAAAPARLRDAARDPRPQRHVALRARTQARPPRRPRRQGGGRRHRRRRHRGGHLRRRPRLRGGAGGGHAARQRGRVASSS